MKIRDYAAPGACVLIAATVAAASIVGPAVAEADTQPTARMVVVKNTAGDLSKGYRCVLSDAGGVDCDWGTPVKVPRR